MLGKLGSGADVVSKGELKLALDAGINPSKIVFSGVGKKTKEEIIYALRKKFFKLMWNLKKNLMKLMTWR